ncbi:flavodoxin [Selenomonas sp.]|jgi:uncharacterized lipoprotein YehR (DUF1307 family)|uniref:flavodoxin n=1 Tax=Selenomonas sp. TaxID=2053611 RepID=UPI003A0FDBEE
MKVKKILALVMGALLAVMVAGCGDDESSGAAASSGKAASSTASSSEKPQASGKKALVVYYSDTGRTEQVAKDLAKAKDADLMKIEPTQKYTKDDLDYNNPDGRVSKEHDDDTLRDKITLKKTMPDNWAEYETVYIGYPIWWGIAAWPMNAFVRGNDFTGKHVVTFATAASSPLGSSGQLLKEMAGSKGDWEDGTCFTGRIDDAKVAEWAKSLK